MQFNSLRLQATSYDVKPFDKKMYDFDLSMSLIGKFRSARMQLLSSNHNEFVTDSITQYIVQGSITYNRPQIGNSETTKQTDAMIRGFEQLINMFAKRLLTYVVGKAIIL